MLSAVVHRVDAVTDDDVREVQGHVRDRQRASRTPPAVCFRAFGSRHRHPPPSVACTESPGHRPFRLGGSRASPVEHMGCLRATEVPILPRRETGKVTPTSAQSLLLNDVSNIRRARLLGENRGAARRRPRPTRGRDPGGPRMLLQPRPAGGSGLRSTGRRIAERVMFVARPTTATLVNVFMIHCDGCGLLKVNDDSTSHRRSVRCAQLRSRCSLTIDCAARWVQAPTVSDDRDRGTARGVG